MSNIEKYEIRLEWIYPDNVWEATSPRFPGLRGSATSESLAIDLLLRAAAPAEDPHALSIEEEHRIVHLGNRLRLLSREWNLVHAENLRKQEELRKSRERENEIGHELEKTRDAFLKLTSGGER